MPAALKPRATGAERRLAEHVRGDRRRAEGGRRRCATLLPRQLHACARLLPRGPQVCTALLVTLALGCLPAAAGASETAKLKVSFFPNKLGAYVTIHTHLTLGNTNGGLPSPVTAFDVHIPAELELIGSTLGLAICQPGPLLEGGLGSCPPNARIGSGTATVTVPFGPEYVSETAEIQVLMGPPAGEQVGVLLYAESRTPVFAQLVFPGALEVGTGIENLNTSFPPVPTLPGAPDATVTSMSLEVGPEHLTYYKRVHNRRVAYRPTGIALPPKCPRGGFLFVADMRFLDGTTLTASSTVPCPPARRH
jgi:hypothetical protein